MSERPGAYPGSSIASDGLQPAEVQLDPTLYNFRGEVMTQPNPYDLASRYVGRIDFGTGSIDAENFTETEFMDLLSEVRQNCLVFASDLRAIRGGCMDGRGDFRTDSGQNVVPRPKVIGGPSLFAWYVASIGQLDIISGIDDPLMQFATVNKALINSGIQLGMHHECGAARGIVPITEKYLEGFDDVNRFIGEYAHRLAFDDKGQQRLKAIKNGIEICHDTATRHPNFNEENMLMLVRTIGDPHSVVQLLVDHNHPNHGHDEVGFVFMRVKHAIIDKDKVNKTTGKKLFYNNSVYADMIVSALATSVEEKARGLIIADGLPLAGVGTLGKFHHVGELTGDYLLAA